MKKISVLGIDLAKSIFHLHGIDENGKCVVRKKYRRSKLSEYLATLSKCTIAMEACATAHYWGRKCQAYGHDVKLISPQFVKPFVKSQKNDANDAEAICEASIRPTMRFVPVKTEDQQDILAIHSAREMVVSQRTALSNHIRAQLAERGLVTKTGIANLMALVVHVLDGADNRTNPVFKDVLTDLYEHLKTLEQRKTTYDKKLERLAKEKEPCQRLMAIPGIGSIGATALYANVGNGHDFKNGRQMSAWVGLVPRQDTTGGRPKLLGITKGGNKYLRKILIHGSRAVVSNRNRLKGKPKLNGWLTDLEKRRHRNIVVVALAAKNVRTAWALLSSGNEYKAA